MIRGSVADVRALLAGEDSESSGLSRVHPMTKKPMNDDNRGWPEHVAYAGYFSLLPHDGFRACTCPRCAAEVLRLRDGERSRLA
ncbi:MAG: hypothetical protein GXY83_06065 [Rhodopirellula sp.]|mgnify:FL=1|nr:hypothetical protein [Rhodopirellula sp.]